MNKQEIKENLLVFAIFTGILLPLRLVFYEYLQDHWIGSFGITSLVVFLMFYLSARGKLGSVGKIITKTIEKRAKAKSSILMIGLSIIMIWISAMMILGSIYADPNLTKLYKEELANHGITDIQSTFSDKDIDYKPIVLLEAMASIFIPTPDSLAFYHIMNDFSDGFFLAIFTVLMIEEIELLGITIYFRKFSNVSAPIIEGRKGGN